MVVTEMGPKNEQTLKRGRNILTYLFLPTHWDKLNRWFILIDFVQFLLVCRQLIVFRIESIAATVGAIIFFSHVNHSNHFSDPYPNTMAAPMNQ